jgi:putative transposase
MRKESQKYNHYNHGVGLAMAHLVFCSKRRKKVLVGEIRDRLFELWQALSSEKGWHIRALEINPDHVHLFLEVKPTDSIHLVVKAFKVEHPDTCDRNSLACANFLAFGVGVISSALREMLALR